MNDKYGGLNYSPIKPSKPLSEELYLFRTRRPDEWTMQEFGRNAVWLEQKLAQVERERNSAQARLDEVLIMVQNMIELNPSNYDHDDVCRLNDEVIELYSFLANQNTDCGIKPQEDKE